MGKKNKKKRQNENSLKNAGQFHNEFDPSLLVGRMLQPSDQEALLQLRQKLSLYARRMNFAPPEYTDDCSGSRWRCHITLNGVKYGADDDWQSTEMKGTFSQIAVVEQALVMLNQLRFEETLILKIQQEMYQKMHKFIQTQNSTQNLPNSRRDELADVASKMRFDVPTYKNTKFGSRWLSFVTVNGAVHQCDVAACIGFTDVVTADNAAAEKALIELGAMTLRNAFYNEKNTSVQVDEEQPCYQPRYKCWYLAKGRELAEGDTLPSDWHNFQTGLQKYDGAEPLAGYQATSQIPTEIGNKGMSTDQLEVHSEQVRCKLVAYCRLHSLPAPVYRTYRRCDRPNNQYIVTVVVGKACYTGLYIHKRSRAIVSCTEQALVRLNEMSEMEVRVSHNLFTKRTKMRSPPITDCSDPLEYNSNCAKNAKDCNNIAQSCLRRLLDKVEENVLLTDENLTETYKYNPPVPRKVDEDLSELFELELDMKTWLLNHLADDNPLFEYKHFSRDPASNTVGGSDLETGDEAEATGDRYGCRLYADGQFRNESLSSHSFEHAEHRAAHMELFIDYIIDIPPVAVHTVAKMNKRMNAARKMVQVDDTPHLSSIHPNYAPRLGTYALKNKLGIPILRTRMKELLSECWYSTVEVNGVVYKSMEQSHKASENTVRNGAAEQALLALGVIDNNGLFYNISSKDKSIKFSVWKCTQALLSQVESATFASSNNPSMNAKREVLQSLCSSIGWEAPVFFMKKSGTASYTMTVMVNDLFVASQRRSTKPAAVEEACAEMLMQVKSMESEILQLRQFGPYPRRDFSALRNNKNCLNILKDDLSWYAQLNKLEKPRYETKSVKSHVTGIVCNQNQTTVTIGSHSYTSSMLTKKRETELDGISRAFIGLHLMQQEHAIIAMIEPSAQVNNQWKTKRSEPTETTDRTLGDLNTSMSEETLYGLPESEQPNSTYLSKRKHDINVPYEYDKERPAKKHCMAKDVELLSGSGPYSLVDTVMDQLCAYCMGNGLGEPCFNVQRVENQKFMAILSFGRDRFLQGAPAHSATEAQKDAAESALVAFGVIPHKMCQENSKIKKRISRNSYRRQKRRKKLESNKAADVEEGWNELDAVEYNDDENGAADLSVLTNQKNHYNTAHYDTPTNQTNAYSNSWLDM